MAQSAKEMISIGEMAVELQAHATGERLETELRESITAITHDSRRVVPGGIFVAIQGAHSDGNLFVGEAAKRGAIAIISDKPRPVSYLGVWLQVADARAVLARAASVLFGVALEETSIGGRHGDQWQDDNCPSGSLDFWSGR
jgi:UDP-N-acetylmuramyl pentapeptide synthase